MADIGASAEIVLIFDGDCSFCSSCVDFLERTLPVMPKAVPFQNADLSGYGLSTVEAESRVWLITPDRHHGGAGAVSALLRHQPDAALRFLGWLIQTPPLSWFADLGYAVVSRLRHLLPGGTPACRR
jgi:predicted DCC family thiol-disulfide oxidoreductase YuxK